MKTPLKICLCDLTHDSIILVSDTIPINIGFVGSYAKHKFGDAITVSLYKYPAAALAAIKADPPDIVGLSNYSWNSNLSERVAAAARAVNPAVVVVQGGTNFPHDDALRTEFLSRRPATDGHIEYEGEVSFANLVRRVLDARDGGPRVFDAPIEGILFLEPSTRGSTSPVLIKSKAPERLRDLDVIPSPYLNGMLEHFFDGRLTPFIETNRGCPFRCSFCHTGADYFNKMNSFSIERVREEIFYIAPRAAELKVSNLHIADTNFGMFPRDREICEALFETQQKFGWPRQVMATTGKNSKERVIEITGILGKIFSVNMSVQSMDEGVLKNIRRSNIKLDHYMEINKHLSLSGRSTKAELIIGLPGETRETFLNGVEAVIESNASSVTIYTLMLLNGTEFKEPEYRKKFGIEGRFRIVPLNFGDYDGERVLDYEEVCVHTNSMSFADYLFLRGFALDNRGHGESAKPHDPARYSREAMARDVFALLDHAGVERAHLLGFSMGAHISLTAALLDGSRIDHLVVAGVGGRMFEPPRDEGAMAEAMEAQSPDSISDPMLKSFRHFADEQKEDRLALAACSRGARVPLTRDSLSAIRRPALVVAGARDQLAGPPQPLADAIPDAKAVTLPGCDHFSCIGHPLFKASVFDFFDGWLE